MRGFDLVSSLIDVWGYSLHIIDGQPLQGGLAVGLDPAKTGPLKEHIHPWDLDLLAREVLLNAGNRRTYSLRWWGDLAIAINHLRRLDGVAFLENKDPQSDVLFELHRIAHRQFPWQMGKNTYMSFLESTIPHKTLDKLFKKPLETSIVRLKRIS
jgi:hypothetical protein